MTHIVQRLLDIRTTHGDAKEAAAYILYLESLLPKLRDDSVPDIRTEDGSTVYRKDGKAGQLHFQPDVGWIVWPHPDSIPVGGKMGDYGWPVIPEDCTASFTKKRLYPGEGECPFPSSETDL